MTSQQHLRNWGFPPIITDEDPISLVKSLNIQAYFRQYLAEFPKTKSLTLFGHGYNLLRICRALSFQLLSDEKIKTRINVMPMASMLNFATNSQDVTSKIATADLTIITEVGLFKLSAPQLNNLYYYIAEPLYHGAQLIFTSSNPPAETLENLTKPIFNLLEGTTHVLDTGD